MLNGYIFITVFIKKGPLCIEVNFKYLPTKASDSQKWNYCYLPLHCKSICWIWAPRDIRPKCQLMC